MPPRRSDDACKIPDICWGENNDVLVWSLLGEVEKEENYRVLYGKNDPKEVSYMFTSLFSNNDML